MSAAHTMIERGRGIETHDKDAKIERDRAQGAIRPPAETIFGRPSSAARASVICRWRDTTAEQDGTHAARPSRIRAATVQPFSVTNEGPRLRVTRDDIAPRTVASHPPAPNAEKRHILVGLSGNSPCGRWWRICRGWGTPALEAIRGALAADCQGQQYVRVGRGQVSWMRRRRRSSVSVDGREKC
ncbi:hypothetical protein K438DRAFT_1751399 [Mycena galopus ATCC 62051]|nr:hypothetical protein K438DRAFT_1751399 [Mycena galopus ATCC 62051]